METTDDRSDACVECGQPLNGEVHACAEPETPSSGVEPRISIPAGLWNTGLFKPAWNRGPAAPEARTSDAPPKVTSGSLLSRPADLPAGPEAPPEVVDEKVDHGPDVTEDTSESGPFDASETPDVPHDAVAEAAESAAETPEDEIAEPADTEPEVPAEEATSAPEVDSEPQPDWVGPDVVEPEPDVVEPEPDVVEPEPDLEPEPEPEIIETQPEPEPEPEVVEPEPAPSRVTLGRGIDSAFVVPSALIAAATEASEVHSPVEVPEDQSSAEDQPEFPATQAWALQEQGPDAREDNAAATDTSVPETSSSVSPIAAAELAAAAALSDRTDEESATDDAPEVEDAEVEAPADASDRSDDADVDGGTEADELDRADETDAFDDSDDDDSDDLAATQSIPADPADPEVHTSHESTAFMRRSAPTGGLTPPTARTNPASPTPDDGQPRKRKGWIVALVLVLLLAVAAGGWLWWQRSQDEPVSEAFRDSNAAFLDASRSLTEASNVDEVAAAAGEFATASDLLAETRSAAEGRTSDLSTSVRRAVGAQLQVSEAAEGLTALADEEFGAWGDARGDLRAGLDELAGVEKDIETAGGSTEGLPTANLVPRTDKLVGKAAQRSAVRRINRMVSDLASAEQIKDLRAIGKRAGAGATSLTGAVDSLADSKVDTDLVAAHAGVQTAAAKLTRLRPDSLNQWEPIRAQLDQTGQKLPDGGQALTPALASADTMVDAAANAWSEWEELTAVARTQKDDDLEAVRTASEAIAEIATDFETIDESLASFLAGGDSLPAEGTAGEAYTTLDAVADSVEELGATLAAIDTPDEVASEVDSLLAALDASATSIQEAADAAATCVDTCQITATTGWSALVDSRSSQASAVAAAVKEWRAAVGGARKEIRQRPLPERPQI